MLAAAQFNLLEFLLGKVLNVFFNEAFLKTSLYPIKKKLCVSSRHSKSFKNKYGFMSVKEIPKDAPLYKKRRSSLTG